MFRKIVLGLGIIGVILSIVLGIFSIITYDIVTIVITVSIGIPSLVFASDKKRPEKQKLRDKKSFFGRKDDDYLRDETIIIPPKNGYSYELELPDDFHIEGTIDSTQPVDVCLVDVENFQKWNRGRKRINSENCSERILNGRIDYEVPKAGKWYILVDNHGRKTAKVKIYLY